MPMAAFDTMSVARRLQKEFGMPEKQAEGVAVVLHENFVGNVATKEDLAQAKQVLGADIQRVEDTLTAKIDHVEETLTAKIDHVEETLTAKIDHVEETLTAKIDHVEETLTAKIEALEERVILKMTVRLGGIMVAIFAFFEILNRVFPIAGG
ncbi:hypothetical protein [Ruegeria sp.]|uniref:hypothetical protein n=1 Tax=Ruegeria sp. TaxID=1879320 RepID=UPI003B007DF9